MKYVLHALLGLIGIQSFAQYDSLKLPIPMQNGIIFYEQSYRLPKQGSSDEAFNRAEQWFKTASDEFKKSIHSINGKTGNLSGTVLFKIKIPETSNYYWIRAQMEIMILRDGFTVEVFNYYEKPIEKGITNDYSKIEYRWWDFRKGKPWSSEDETVFNGLHQNTELLIASILRAINGSQSIH